MGNYCESSVFSSVHSYFLTTIVVSSVNDRILSINGINVQNAEHHFVVSLLKESNNFISMVCGLGHEDPQSEQLVTSS